MNKVTGLVALVLTVQSTNVAMTDDGLAAIGFDGSRQLLVLPVSLAGMDFEFVLDTGSSAYLVDEPLQRYLGKSLRVVKSGSGVDVKLFAPPGDFRIGGFKTPIRGEVGCLDLNSLKRAGGPMDGIIGSQFVCDNVVQLDFENSVVRLMIAIPSDGELGEKIPLLRIKRGLALNVDVGGRRLQCVIDTGSTAAVAVTPKVFDELLAAGHLNDVSTLSQVSIAGTRERRFGRVQQLKLGGYTLPNSRIRESTTNAIGIGFLSRFTVTFDGPSSSMYLLSNPRTFDPRYENLSGIGLDWTSGGVFVHSVDNGSPAHQAGLRSGDQIVEVNGTPVEFSQLKRLLRSKPGVKLSLLVSRESVERKVEFSLLRKTQWDK